MKKIGQKHCLIFGYGDAHHVIDRTFFLIAFGIAVVAFENIEANLIISFFLNT